MNKKVYKTAMYLPVYCYWQAENNDLIDENCQCFNFSSIRVVFAIKNMIQRETYLSKLRQLKDQNIIKVITGVRRCGYCWLFRIVLCHLYRSVCASDFGSNCASLGYFPERIGKVSRFKLCQFC